MTLGYAYILANAISFVNDYLTFVFGLFILLTQSLLHIILF